MSARSTQAIGGYHAGQIDGLRALAVGSVLYAHFCDAQSELGHYGVRLFFVISGFLITRILLVNRFEAGEPARARIAASFYARRVLRIFPAYYLLMLVLAFNGAFRDTIGWHLLFGSNILFSIRDQWSPWIAAHLWSLSVEEQFYLIWPAFMLCLPRRLILPFLLLSIAASVVSKELVYRASPEELDSFILMPFAVDALAAGAILGCLDLFGARDESIAWIRLTLLGLSVLLLALIVTGMTSRWSIQVFDALLVVPMGYAVLAGFRGMSGPAGLALGWAPVRYLGRISYGIYLWHVPVAAILTRLFMLTGSHLPDSGFVWFCLAGAGTCLVAALSWHFFENPINGLKRRFPYDGRVAAKPSPQVE